MTNDTLNNPHDHFFRNSFSYPDVSVPFFQRYLRTEVREGLDFTTLAMEPGSFVDARLADHHTDLLFSIRRQDGLPARLFLLLEHKSYNTPWAGLQLLDYLVRIWQQEAKERRQPPLTPVIGMVLYHGESTWTGGERFAPLVDTPAALARFTPDFEFVLCDLHQEQLDYLQDAARLAIALQLLKFIRSDELPARLPEIFELFQKLEVHEDDALAYAGTAIRYIVRVARQVDRATLEAAVVRGLPPGLGERVMPTIAESWIEEGRLEGIQKGRIEEARWVLHELLRQRFGELPESAKQRVEQADQETLHRWIFQVLSAGSLDEVFRGDRR